MSNLGANPCMWCQERICAGTRSPGQLCYIQFIQEETTSTITLPFDNTRGGRLDYPDGMPNEEYFKDQAVSRQKYWKRRGEGVNGYAECDAQYLEDQK